MMGTDAIEMLDEDDVELIDEELAELSDLVDALAAELTAADREAGDTAAWRPIPRYAPPSPVWAPRGAG
jgi:hypothetical protein